jgi:hypothetical protein
MVTLPGVLRVQIARGARRLTFNPLTRHACFSIFLGASELER